MFAHNGQKTRRSAHQCDAIKVHTEIGGSTDLWPGGVVVIVRWTCD